VKKTRTGGGVIRPIAFFDGARGRLTIYNDIRGVAELITTLACLGQKIRIDDGQTYPELYEGGGTSGRPLEWSLDIKHMGSDFARGYGARLYKKREGYEGAIERMRADADFE
jgi:hypothetical protein